MNIKNKNIIYKFTILCIIFLIYFASPAYATLAAAIKGKAIPQTNGLIKYFYNIKNQESRDFNLTDFGVSVSTTANVKNIRCPSGWVTYYHPGDERIAWEASAHPTYDLKPGTSAVFSFESAGSPSRQVYSTEGIDTDKQAVNGEVKAAYIVGPGEFPASNPNVSVDLPSERESPPCPAAYGPRR